MDKSPTAFRTISEVATELALPQHVLRFWETKFSQVRPLKRGGGRRYYRPEDVDLLQKIQFLLYEQGYTIKGVQKLLKSKEAFSAALVKADDPALVNTLVSEGLAEDGIAANGGTDPELTTTLAPAQTDARAALASALADLKAIRARLRPGATATAQPGQAALARQAAQPRDAAQPADTAADPQRTLAITAAE